jgi:hypothetical protein
MLSGRRPILMRVRISFDALRLCLLVAAGVTSGYLWRAAFESSAPEERLAATPRIVEKAPVPKTVRIEPRHLVKPSKAAAAHRPVTRLVARQVRRAPLARVSTPVAVAPTQPTSTPSSTPSPSSTPKPTPTPTKPPPASPPPATTTPTQTQSTTPAVAASPQPATVPSATSTVGEAEKPGWGKGDKNHDHTGPGTQKP